MWLIQSSQLRTILCGFITNTAFVINCYDINTFLFVFCGAYIWGAHNGQLAWNLLGIRPCLGTFFEKQRCRLVVNSYPWQRWTPSIRERMKEKKRKQKRSRSRKYIAELCWLKTYKKLLSICTAKFNIVEKLALTSTSR